MRRALVLLLLALTAVDAAAEVVPSRIREATVYTDRARVVREATVDVRTGLNTIRLQTTAFRVDPDSLTAKVFGEGELFGVQYKQVPVEESPIETIKALEQTLRELRRGLQGVADRKTAVEKQRSFLDSFIDFSKVQVPQEIQTRLPDAAALETTLSFLQRGFEQSGGRLQELEAEIEARQREIDRVEKELAALRAGEGNTLKVVEILFQSRRAQQIRVEAEYQVAEAAWHPIYKAAVPESADTVALTMFADIRQKSGEDWENVNLSVSTAPPLTGGRLPDLAPWIVDLPRPAAPRAPEAEALRTMAVAKKADRMEDADQMLGAAPAPYAQAEARRSLLAVQYALAQPVTVASRDQETVVPVFTRSLTGDFRHLTVPKLDASAYFVCRSQADAELLAGPLQIHFAGQYLGKSRLEQMRAGSAFYLNLGVDRGVLVRREKIADNRRETFFGRIERDTVVREIAYRIVLENTTRRNVTVDVLDHVPVSRTDRIRIADLKCTPEPAVRDDQGREGVMRWQRQLSAGGKEEIEVSFTLSHPEDVDLTEF